MISPSKQPVEVTRCVPTGIFFRGHRVLIEAKDRDTLGELDRTVQRFNQYLEMQEFRL